jgi:hypothetical protein
LEFLISLFSRSAWICVYPLSSAVYILFFLPQMRADKHRFTQIN